MIRRFIIKNFKSIENMDLYFDTGVSNIIGNNGSGKTSVLEALSFILQQKKVALEEVIQEGKDYLYLDVEFENQYGFQKLIFSYEKSSQKKNILLNGKKVTKKVLFEHIPKLVGFYPITMNLFYLGPKYRRDFLDELLSSCYSEYTALLTQYETILKSRNKLLKNIQEGKSLMNEIHFWDQQFIQLSEKIYKYRFHLVDFFQNHIHTFQSYFGDKVPEIQFEYKTKVQKENVIEIIQNYLTTNLSRDIILGKTHIGPHIDDFDILINKKPIFGFASRGETKSVILGLKLLEIDYIKSTTSQLPTLLIDDFSSELDDQHEEIILQNMSFLQIITTSIKALEWEKTSIIKI